VIGARALVMVAGLAWFLLAATPSLGCSGSRLAGDTLTAGPDGIVFTGTAVRREDPLVGTQTWMDDIAWTFVVDDVRQGDVSDRITVMAGRDDGVCGTGFELGQRYTVHAEPGVGWMRVPFGQTDLLEPLADAPPVEGRFVAFLHPFTLATVAVGLLALLVVVRLTRRRRGRGHVADTESRA
jgi:hypothetical protein